MVLYEALQLKKLSYSGTRENYTIHDDNPSVLVLDNDYNVDLNGKSLLGFNINYLDNLSTVEKQKLIRRVSSADNKVLDFKGVKAWLKMKFNKGDYKGLSKNQKIKRYKEIVKKFPELKKVIRRYKYTGIGDSSESPS